MDSRQAAVQGGVASGEDASSVSSAHSDHRPAHLDSRNGSRNGSRHASYTPSYMSNIAAKSTEGLTLRTSQSRDGRPIPPSPLHNNTTQPADTPSKPPEPSHGPSGLLFVLIANTVHPSTIFFLEMLLHRQNFSGILFAANKSQEAALKQLKMDVYALIGRLRKELVVAVHMKHEWNQAEMEAFAAEATKHGDGLQGVLCCPEFDEMGTEDVDIMTLAGDELERSWKQSVSFLHAANKATVIHLLTRCRPLNSTSNGSFARTLRGPFFLVTGSTTYTSASQITKSACDTIVLQLERATKAQGLTVGFAEAMLVPEPTREPPPKPGDELPVLTGTYDAEHEDYEFVPSESPTKLWSSWALHNDPGAVED